MSYFASGGYAALFGVTVVTQVGLPIPAFPAMIAAGALARSGHMSVPVAVAFSVAGIMFGDVIWFELGRAFGPRSLRVFKRVSPDLESSIDDMRGLLQRRGPLLLLIHNFIPGMIPLTPALLGASRLSRATFYGLNLLGAFVFGTFFVGMGYVFGDEFRGLMERLDFVGIGLLALVPAVLILAKVAWGFYRRRHAAATRAVLP